MEAITFYILRKKYVISRNIYLIEKNQNMANLLIFFPP